jgi:heme exporter protein D
MDLGAPHIGFVIAAYALSLSVLVALAAIATASLKARQRELRMLEERQAPRRKQQT